MRARLLAARVAARLGVLALALASGVAVAGDAPNAQATVILISLDGTRPVDVTEADMPALSRFAGAGLRAERMLASVPTNTFPNHVTLATGVRPEKHGLVDNVFVDPQRGVFDKRDIHSYIEVEPIWSLLERAGVPTAVYHWVGSEGAVAGGLAPRRFEVFSPKTPAATKVERILAWLDLPAADGRPRLICSWMHGADHAGHVHGPGSPEVRAQLRAQDVALGHLIDGIADRGLWPETTLIFVSDHGMTAARERVDLGTRLRDAGVRANVYGIGGFATVVVDAPEAEKPAAIARVVALARDAGLYAEPRRAAPASDHVDHPRFGDVVVRAPLGTAIVYPGLELEGFHGYPPEAPSMAALLIAGGRGVRPGTTVDVVSGLDVAPTILGLLGQPVPSSMQGRPIPGLVAPARPSATLAPPRGPAPAAPASSIRKEP